MYCAFEDALTYHRERIYAYFVFDVLSVRMETFEHWDAVTF
jgi:hypothetical protein